jgi:hypothetical protein
MMEYILKTIILDIEIHFKIVKRFLNKKEVALYNSVKAKNNHLKN